MEPTCSLQLSLVATTSSSTSQFAYLCLGLHFGADRENDNSMCSTEPAHQRI